MRRLPSDTRAWPKGGGKQAKLSSVRLWEEKPRKFLETIELQIALKDYDVQRDKRFAGSVKLPHVPRPRMKVTEPLFFFRLIRSTEFLHFPVGNSPS